MAQVQIDVGGRSYQVSCRDGEEQRLTQLGRLVDAHAADVIRAIGTGDEARQLLMTALLLADELDEARGVVTELAAEETGRTAAIARCAERIDALAAKLENGGQSA
jgi:cell division protein ZapA